MNPSRANPECTPRDIFLEALELPVDERAAFLDRACANHATLRAAVDDLLVHHQDDSFLEAGAIDCPTRLDPSMEKPGDTIGRYRLLQEIGEGGFGSVWMAEQTEPVTRRVALKIIKLGMDTREVIARFEAERQALALMDHPNIARVLDGGATAQGRPYFVMELVKGLPITKFCDQAQLGMRDRLRLFRDVCAAISHAHQKGIIHRDIKPSNVMVTLHGDAPVVKVIDFGIAKATQGRLTEKTLFTRFEQFIGTPVYMSPEQACLSGLDIDTRSDIYALGILLYELLTGTPPFDAGTLASAGYEEMRRIIREVDPPKPSSRLGTVVGKERTTLAKARQTAPEKLSRLVETDLDWIVMKAIDKDRNRRYETANGLARDIQSFLDDEPVSATPPSAAYRFRKFARRHRAGLRMAAALLAMLLVATGVSLWQAVRATLAEARTAESLRQVAAERDAKHLALQESQTVSSFLDRLLRSPSPGRDGREIRVVELLDQAAIRLEADLTNQPARRASLQSVLGGSYSALGLPRQAIPLQEKARTFSVQSEGPKSPRTLRLSLALANSYADAGRLEEARSLAETVLPLQRAQLGSTHPDTLSTLNSLATIYWGLGRRKEAVALQEEVVAGRREVLGPDHFDTLSALMNQATFLDQSGSRGKAIEILESVVAIQRRTVRPEDPGFLTALQNLASFYANDGNALKAQPLAEEVLPLNRKVFGPEHPWTLNAMSALAFAYHAAGRYDHALPLAREVWDLFRKVSGPDHPDTLQAERHAAAFSLKAGRTEEALLLLEASVDHQRKVLGAEHLDTLKTQDYLAIALDAADRPAEALEMRVKTLAALRRTQGDSTPDTLSAIHNLALSFSKAGRHQEALALAEEAVSLALKMHGPDHPDTLLVKQHLAVARSGSAPSAGADSIQEETFHRGPLPPGADPLEIRSALTGTDLAALESTVTNLRLSGDPLDPKLITALLELAAAQGQEGNSGKAIKLGEEALALARRRHNDTECIRASIRILAPLYRTVDLEVEARTLEQEARSLPPPAR